MHSFTKELGDFLEDVNASLKVNHNNIIHDARSDFHYRAFVILCSIKLLGGSSKKTNESLLKIAHNVAVKGKLRELIQFLENQRKDYFILGRSYSFNYLDTDESFDKVFRLLEISQYIFRVNKDTIGLSKEADQFISEIISTEEFAGVFSQELEALSIVKGLRIKKKDLGL